MALDAGDFVRVRALIDVLAPPIKPPKRHHRPTPPDQLPTHHRVLAIAVQRRAECLGTYLVALAFSRRNELDGYVPRSAFEQLGPKTRRGTVPELLRVGLLGERSRPSDSENAAVTLLSRVTSG